MGKLQTPLEAAIEKYKVCNACEGKTVFVFVPSESLDVEVTCLECGEFSEIALNPPNEAEVRY
jgi:hypothetical protein